MPVAPDLESDLSTQMTYAFDIRAACRFVQLPPDVTFLMTILRTSPALNQERRYA